MDYKTRKITIGYLPDKENLYSKKVSLNQTYLIRNQNSGWDKET